MSTKCGTIIKTKRSWAASILLALLIASSPYMVLAAEVENHPDPNDEFSVKYRDLTKQALTAGIELERFNLNYSLESSRQPKWRALRYSIAQEVGSVGILTFEVVADRQFGRGRKNPASVNQGALRGALIDALGRPATATCVGS